MPRNGVVVAPQPSAAETGAEILAAGGTAFDAAVATALVQTVVDPFMCGIGGIGVAQVYDAATRESAIIDFYGRVGSRATPDQWAKAARRSAEGKTYVKDFPNHLGYRSILVPATVAGLAAVHAQGGRLPWRDLVLPAARIACLSAGSPPPTGRQAKGLDRKARIGRIKRPSKAAQEALEATLAQYPGTLVLVSHDRSFLEAVGPDVVIEL